MTTIQGLEGIILRQDDLSLGIFILRRISLDRLEKIVPYYCNGD
jgi:hypothetical protein